MTRKDFITKVGIGGFVALTACLQACSSETATPSTNTNNTNTNSGSKIDFTLDLDAAANAALKTNGGFLYNGNIIVARTKDGLYVAVSKICTHEGTTIAFDVNSNIFRCPNHGATFGTDGKVLQSPAKTDLKVYKTQVTNNILRIFE